GRAGARFRRAPGGDGACAEVIARRGPPDRACIPLPPTLTALAVRRTHTSSPPLPARQDRVADETGFWLYLAAASVITPAFRCPAKKGCRGNGISALERAEAGRPGRFSRLPPQRRAKCPS